MGMERLPRLSKTVAASYNEMGRQRPATAFPFEVKTMLTVAKFGGSSLASAERFLRVREIVRADASRRVVVVSAAGKRHAADHKITDLLYLCHAHLQYGVPCRELWRMIAGRYTAIRDGCGLRFPIERELEAIYASLSPATPRDFLASRGEYLAARLMAELLEFTFVDAADWLRFDSAGNVLREASYAALRSLADERKIVTPGFYGLLPSGAVHTFPRGGSDVTGSLAAAALHADVCENWTDVPGILAADPSVVSRPQSVPYLSYAELQALSAVGMQVLHESAVEPVRRRRIPLQIRSSLEPELPGTRIGPEPAEKTKKTRRRSLPGGGASRCCAPNGRGLRGSRSCWLRRRGRSCGQGFRSCICPAGSGSSRRSWSRPGRMRCTRRARRLQGRLAPRRRRSVKISASLPRFAARRRRRRVWRPPFKARASRSITLPSARRACSWR